MKTHAWLTVILFLAAIPAFSQETPVFNHYYADPYLINSAMAGEDYRPSLYFSHRRQWMGIEGAPVTSSVVFHTPLGEKFALGLQAYNDSRGLLNATTGLVTFAYKAMFAPDHFLKFGLTGGVLSRSIRDFDDILNDPRYYDDAALMTALDKNMFLDGRFGFNYHLKGFNLGFTLPRLFSSGLLSAQQFTQGEFNPMNTYQAILYYKSENRQAPLRFEPYIIYKAVEGDDSRFEGAGILRIKNVVWLGGIYRQYQGLSALGGINLSDNLQFGYSYDLTADPAALSKGTHEVLVKINFGEEKRPRKKERTIVEEKDPYDKYQENKNNPGGDEPPVNTASAGKISDYKGPVVVKEGVHKLDLKKGHYLVVGVFGSHGGAKEYSDMLFQTGFFTKYGYSSDAGYYYVYIHYADSEKETVETVMKELVQRSQFSDSWVLTVQ